MEVEKNRISLHDDIYAYVNRSSNAENIAKFKKQVKKYISILNRIIEADFDKLTDKKLYDLLTKVYSITLTEEDYLEMFSISNGKKYSVIHLMPTTQTFYERKAVGHGSCFDWDIQLYQIYYSIAISDEMKFDYNKTYSKAEIKKLASEKTIVILNEKTIPIEEDTDFNQEEHEAIPSLDIEFKSYSDNMSNFVTNNFSLFGKLLRKKFKKENVLKDMRELLDDIQDDIESIFSNINSQDWCYSQISTGCKNWFDSSAEKEEYQNLQKRIRLKINSE